LKNFVLPESFYCLHQSRKRLNHCGWIECPYKKGDLPVTLNEMFYKVILLNELSGNIRAALRFSDPDGVLTGKSGWSFGLVQFDTQNNSLALTCLRECGVTEAEIQGIVKQNIDVKPLARKLVDNALIVRRYDEMQLSYCLNKALNFDMEHGIPVESPGGILAGADYVNQYGSQGNGAKTYYKSLGRPITAEDVLRFKLELTKWGREHPDDCKRRYNNIVKVVEASHA